MEESDECDWSSEEECCMEECEECGDILHNKYGGMDYLSNGICKGCDEGHEISDAMAWYLEEYENAIHEEHNYKINTTMAFFVHIRQWFPIEIRGKIWSMYLNTQ